MGNGNATGMFPFPSQRFLTTNLRHFESFHRAVTRDPARLPAQPAWPYVLITLRVIERTPTSDGRNRDTASAILENSSIFPA